MGVTSKALIGTDNSMKVLAAKLAFGKIGITNVKGVSVETGIPPQPVGLVETLAGALTRAVKTRNICGDCFTSGVESGIIPYPAPTGYIIQQIAIVVDRQGRISLGLSQGFELYEHEAMGVSMGTELAKVGSKYRSSINIKENLGYIGCMTHGLVTRFDLTVNALLMALKPWIQGDTAVLPYYMDYIDRLKDVFGIDL
ncbi:MAG: inosine/xanthosine triphosphatase [Desulfurococcales archaeon]|nr:inosine/xanthosine triphosphatase [Desulfurococcales archaeon]